MPDEQSPWVVKGVSEKTRRQVKSYAAQVGVPMADAVETLVRAGLEMGQLLRQFGEDENVFRSIVQALDEVRAQLPNTLRGTAEFDKLYGLIMDYLHGIMSRNSNLHSRVGSIRAPMWVDE